MSSPKPFEITRWDAPKEPTLEALQRLLDREKLTAEQQLYSQGSHSPEMMFDQDVVRVMVSGHAQCSFPGYGVVDLQAGDWVEIESGTLHDIKVTGNELAVMLFARRA